MVVGFTSTYAISASGLWVMGGGMFSLDNPVSPTIKLTSWYNTIELDKPLECDYMDKYFS
jgi:hypothetical protein